MTDDARNALAVALAAIVRLDEPLPATERTELKRLAMDAIERLAPIVRRSEASIANLARRRIPLEQRAHELAAAAEFLVEARRRNPRISKRSAAALIARKIVIPAWRARGYVESVWDRSIPHTSLPGEPCKAASES